MSAISRFKLRHKLYRPLFENLLIEKTRYLIYCIRYVAAEEGGDYKSLCALAGLTGWDTKPALVTRHRRNPYKWKVDEGAWFLSAVLLRAGARPEEIFGKYFPMEDMKRHLWWHRLLIPNDKEETEQKLMALQEVDLIIDKAIKRKSSFHKTMNTMRRDIDTPVEELRRIYRDLYEYPDFIGRKKHGYLQVVKNPRVIKRATHKEYVKVHCNNCGSNVLTCTNKMFKSKAGPRGCSNCSGDLQKQQRNKYFVVDVKTGYKYWSIWIAYTKLGLDKPGGIERKQFYRALHQHKVIRVGDTFLWLKKRETKSLATKLRKRLIALGMPSDFKLPTKHLSAKAMQQYKNKLKQRVTERRKERERRLRSAYLSRLVTKQDIKNYRERIEQRWPEVLAATWAMDRIDLRAEVTNERR